jgi:hypothetical protein
MLTNTVLVGLALAGGALSLRAPAPLAARERTNTSRVSGATLPVTFVLIDNFRNPKITAMVSRTPGPQGLDVIFIQKSALSPQLLVVATRDLRMSVHRHGERPSKNVRMFLTGDFRKSRLSATDQAWSNDIVSQLQTAPSRHVRGFRGAYPAVTSQVAMSP